MEIRSRVLKTIAGQNGWQIELSWQKGLLMEAQNPKNAMEAADQFEKTLAPSESNRELQGSKNRGSLEGAAT